MSFYDDERMIIEYFQMVSNSEVHFPFRSRGTIDAFKSVRNTKKWANWTYNAGKADPPPDFFSEKYHLMMEVMRIDDHAFVNEKGVLINPVNMRESKIQREIREKIKSSQPDADFGSIKIVVNAVTDLPSTEDHNYLFYYANFWRALEKHIKKIPLYRSNHSDKKLIFLCLMNQLRMCKWMIRNLLNEVQSRWNHLKQNQYGILWTNVSLIFSEMQILTI